MIWDDVTYSVFHRNKLREKEANSIGDLVHVDDKEGVWTGWICAIGKYNLDVFILRDQTYKCTVWALF